MSLNIDIDKVTAVLLADGWHDVAWDNESTFELDAYEYVDGDHLAQLHARGSDPGSAIHLAGGAEESVGVAATGFRFWTGSGEIMAGPITAILAVRTRD
jgi:hypothetical protein